MSWIALITGILCEASGVYMVFKNITVTFDAKAYSPAPMLLIIGAILIVVALATSNKANGEKKNEGLPWKNAWLILLGIVILGTFIGSHYTPAPDKYKILLDLITFMVALTAVVGFGIYRWIWRNIRDRVDKIADADRNFTTAEVQTSLGFAWWLHFNDEKKKQKHPPDDRSMVYLSRGINNAERALKHADKLNEAEYEEIICRCKSNLAYYLTERHLIKEHAEDKERCLESAFYAYRVAQEKRALQYIRPYEWGETYAWVLWHFAKDQQTKQKAQTIVAGLLERTDTPGDWCDKMDKKWKDLGT